MRCEDFPCCGHELGCCPRYNDAGQQLDMVCTCGARLPINNRSSICDSCLDSGDDECFGRDDGDDDDFIGDEPEDNMTDVEADADTLRSAGYGTDEDYGFYGNDDGGDWY